MSKVIVVVPKKITRKKTKNKKNPFYSFLPFRCDLYYIIVNAHEKKTNVIKNWWCWKWWYYSLSFLVHNNNVLSSRPKIIVLLIYSLRYYINFLVHRLNVISGTTWNTPRSRFIFHFGDVFWPIIFKRIERLVWL